MSDKVTAIKKANVSVNFETMTGYSSRAGDSRPGMDALLWGLKEIVRVLVIDGNTELVTAIVNTTVARTQAQLLENRRVV